jgi:L-threonylcarbamoyladenylate synthase
MNLIPLNPLDHATQLLKEGKLVAIPTETVYGLAADARNPKAIEALYAAKNRPSSNPLIIHIADPEWMHQWAFAIPPQAWILAKAFWPGPLTLILKRHPEVSKRITAGQESVALRIPDHPLTLALLQQFDGGLVAPSANPSGRISPTTAEHVRCNLRHRVDYILDGGPCSIGIESTILSLLDEQPLILREGSIRATEISEILGCPVMSHGQTTDAQKKILIQVPGSAALHYAPLKPLYLFKKNEFLETIKNLNLHDKKCDILSFDPAPLDPLLNIQQWLHMPRDPKAYAQQLYQALHQLDRSPSHCILVEAVPAHEQWNAIEDRLDRAQTKGCF